MRLSARPPVREGGCFCGCFADRGGYTRRPVTDEHPESETRDAEESADIPTRLDMKALTFDPALAASSPTSLTAEDMGPGLADLDEDLRTMTQNNHEVARWRRLSTRGLERPSNPTSVADEPVTDEQDLSDVTDVQMRPISRDAYRPPPMDRGSAEPDTVEQSLEEPSASTTSPGLLRAEDTPVPRPSGRASRSFGAPREVPSRNSDLSALQAVEDLSTSADRTAPFQTLPAQLLARASARPEAWAPSPTPVSQPAPRMPSTRPSQQPSQQPGSERPSARPVFVPKPAPLPSLETSLETKRNELTPTQFVRSPLLQPQEVESPNAEIAGVPQSYVVGALLVLALMIVLATWWIVH